MRSEAENEPGNPMSAPKKQTTIQEISVETNCNWSVGLTKIQQFEWLVDCYRMRLDDTYVHSGDCVGLYGGEGSDGIKLHFLLFCKMCVKNHVIPKEWVWAKFLKYAETQLCIFYE